MSYRNTLTYIHKHEKKIICILKLISPFFFVYVCTYICVYKGPNDIG